ncbi:MAG: MupG family TIM beta-alpha barrel fold protein [Erysipelotrichaceae bacterium]
MYYYGVSVYPDLRPITEIEEYLKTASSYGCRRVFSSMFSVEGSNEQIIDYFREFIKIAHDNKIEVVLDVNTEFLKQLAVEPTDLKLFSDIGVDMLRMDGNYNDERDIKLITNKYGIKIEFNASAVDESFVKFIADNKVDPELVYFGHNFYPQRYTALSWDTFIKANQVIKKYGFYHLSAFVSSNAPDTHGVWDAIVGLPTVEKLRDLPIDLQARVLLATNDIDMILIGNAYANQQELKVLGELDIKVNLPDQVLKSPLINYFKELSDNKKTPIVIKVQTVSDISKIEEEILFDFAPHADMGDSSEWIWRTRIPRFFYNDKKIKYRKYDLENFEVGDIVVVNENYQHYGGEIQIVLEPIINDGTRNLVAKISKEELILLDLIKAKDIVIFKRK